MFLSQEVGASGNNRKGTPKLKGKGINASQLAITYYLFHCPTYTNNRLTLLNKTKSINCSIFKSGDAAVTKIFLFGDNILRNSSNTFILDSTIEYIISP